MGRPRKIAVTMEKSPGTTATMERPKTVAVNIVKCPHCFAPETESRRYAHNDDYIATQGFKLNYMICESATCRNSTGGSGRRWIKRINM